MFEIEVTGGPNRFSWKEIDSRHEQGKAVTGKFSGSKMKLDGETYALMDKTFSKIGFKKFHPSSSSSSSSSSFKKFDINKDALALGDSVRDRDSVRCLQQIGDSKTDPLWRVLSLILFTVFFWGALLLFIRLREGFSCGPT